MLTVLTALATLGGCTAARWYLHRTSRRDSEYAGGRVKLRSLWNEGAAFGLGIPFRRLRRWARCGRSAAVRRWAWG